MRIRITALTSVSDGAGGRYESGAVVDVDDVLAAAWIDAGHAEPTEPDAAEPEPEPGPPKRAVRRAPRRAANR